VYAVRNLPAVVESTLAHMSEINLAEATEPPLAAAPLNINSAKNLPPDLPEGSCLNFIPPSTFTVFHNLIQYLVLMFFLLFFLH